MLFTLLFFFSLFQAACGQRLLAITDRLCSMKTFFVLLAIVLVTIAVAMYLYSRALSQAGSSEEDGDGEETKAGNGLNTKDIIIYCVLGVFGIFGIVSAFIVLYEKYHSLLLRTLNKVHMANVNRWTMFPCN